MHLTTLAAFAASLLATLAISAPVLSLRSMFNKHLYGSLITKYLTLSYQLLEPPSLLTFFTILGESPAGMDYGYPGGADIEARAEPAAAGLEKRVSFLSLTTLIPLQPQSAHVPVTLYTSVCPSYLPVRDSPLSLACLPANLPPSHLLSLPSPFSPHAHA
jgi:hypothetical protein